MIGEYLNPAKPLNPQQSRCLFLYSRYAKGVETCPPYPSILPIPHHPTCYTIFAVLFSFDWGGLLTSPNAPIPSHSKNLQFKGLQFEAYSLLLGRVSKPSSPFSVKLLYSRFPVLTRSVFNVTPNPLIWLASDLPFCFMK